MVDLRSDTITKPTPEMRAAIAAAEVGDDVFGDDPTVKALEERTAEILGKEAALFVPSGTMANQIAVRIHTEASDSILLDANAHIFYYEAGAIASLAGVLPICLPGKRGIFSAADIEGAVRPTDVHFAPARLLCVENTHNRGGGSVWPMSSLNSVTSCARQHQLKTHLDGARIWNASTALAIPESAIAAEFDSVNVCYSKGLGAPVGSAIVSSYELIERARRFRKQFGGGMRQAGIVAAGALYALEQHRQRLSEDHANAKILAEAISAFPNIRVDLASVETNIVLLDTGKIPAPALVSELAKSEVYVLATGPYTIRAVTNLSVNQSQIEQACDAFHDAATRLKSS
jgi:threonine aldolase